MRRNRIDVICSILAVLEKEPDLKFTRLLAKANLSYKLLTKYLDELQSSDLIRKSITKNKSFVLTEKGTAYLKEYQRFLKFSKAFGI